MGIWLGGFVVAHRDLLCVYNESRHFVGIFDGIVNFFRRRLCIPTLCRDCCRDLVS